MKTLKIKFEGIPFRNIIPILLLTTKVLVFSRHIQASGYMLSSTHIECNAVSTWINRSLSVSLLSDSRETHITK